MPTSPVADAHHDDSGNGFIEDGGFEGGRTDLISSTHPDADASRGPYVEQDGDAGAPLGPCALEQQPLGQLCLAPGACLGVSSELRAAAVLWLAPGALPEPNQTLDYWCDTSGSGIHARRVRQSHPLDVALDERTVDDPSLARSARLTGAPDGNWLLATDTAGRLAFGREDFVLLVAASISDAEDVGRIEYTDLLTLSGFTDYQIVLRATKSYGEQVLVRINELTVAGTYSQLSSFDSRLHIFVIRRTGNVLELRVDRPLEGARVEFSVDANLDSRLGTNLMIGTAELTDLPSAAGARVAFVAAFRGAVADRDLGEIENYIGTTLGIGSEPFVDGGTTDVSTDANL